MTKTILFAAAASVVALAAMPAAAADLYYEGAAGVGVTGTADANVDDGTTVITGDLDLETGWLIAGAVGTRVKPNIRLEGEMAISRNELSDIDGMSLEQVAVMGNVLFDFKPDAKVSPYVGAGAGFGRTIVEIDDLGTDNDTGLAWQLRAGVNIRASDTLIWDVGYRYLNMGDYNASDSGTTVDLAGELHAITVGLRFGG